MLIPTYFEKYKDTIKNIDLATIKSPTDLPKELVMTKDGDLTVHYIPFDFINPHAKIILVGITPGFTQLINALVEAQKQLRAGEKDETILKLTKSEGAFSGNMRSKLVEMLDFLRLNEWLGIHTANQLFGTSSDLVHTTSLLKYPVFIKNENYNGTRVNMTSHPVLTKIIHEQFLIEIGQCKDAVIIPLGDKVSKTLKWLTSFGLIDDKRILDGLPHPSGANAERIAYFLGAKNRELLSNKTDPTKIDLAKTALINKIEMLPKINSQY